MTTPRPLRRLQFTAVARAAQALRAAPPRPAPGASAATWSGVRAQAPGAGASGLAAAAAAQGPSQGGAGTPAAGSAERGARAGLARVRPPGRGVGRAPQEVGPPRARRPWARRPRRCRALPSRRLPCPARGGPGREWGPGSAGPGLRGLARSPPCALSGAGLGDRATPSKARPDAWQVIA